ncbi:lipid droplet-regulating VLDL assembly factor AUP1-like [Diadema antillarum]|uniref:lipid droplet-regulating VLDL assembly factor AUP1-like n=1 Tax=Diadema antillarum TaxID=105358 RepID=UPI003A8B6AEC
MAVEIVQLFSHQRIKDSKTAILFAVYLPLGLLIALLRIFIGLHVFIIACILPKQLPIRRYLLRTMCLILGVVVRPSSGQPRDEDAKVLVANHISVLDHFVISLQYPSVVPNVWSLPSILSWTLGYTSMGAADGRQVFLDNVKRHCQQPTLPVLAFPEGAMTNGRAGLLKFSTWAFCIDQDVQPLILTADRPMVNISVEAVGSSLWQDMLWFLFVPCTVFSLRLLPAVKRESYQTADEYSGAVQGLMAQALNVEATPFTSADKAEHIKRISVDSRLPERAPAHSPAATEKEMPQTTERDGPLERMVKQVHDVLPHIPQHIIRKDLESTNSVDATIFNLLENVTEVPTTSDAGRSTSVGGANSSEPHPNRYEPGTTSSAASQSTSPSVRRTCLALSCTKFAAATFGKSSSERQKSLQERKAALLASARRHLAEKENLDK